MQQMPDVVAHDSKWWHWLIGIVAVSVVAWYARSEGGKRASASFYESAAQIIPVLLVALAVEQRVRDNWDALSFAVKAQVIAALVIGEATALVAVALGRTTSEGDYLVFASRPRTDLLACLSAVSLVIGFCGVVLVTLVQRERAIDPSASIASTLAPVRSSRAPTPARAGSSEIRKRPCSTSPWIRRLLAGGRSQRTAGASSSKSVGLALKVSRRTAQPWQYGQCRRSRPQRSRVPTTPGSSSAAPGARRREHRSRFDGPAVGGRSSKPAVASTTPSSTISTLWTY